VLYISKRFLILVLTLNLIMAGCSPQWRSPTAGFLPVSNGSTLPIQEIWCQTTATPISYPIVSDELVYTIQGVKQGTDEVLIVAYDYTGNVRWQQMAESYGLPGYWFVKDGFLVTGTSTSATALNALTGAIVWQKDIGTTTGMAVGDEKGFISTYESVWAFDINNGDVIWEIPGPGRVGMVAPYYLPADNLLILDQTTYRIVDPGSGKVLYETEKTIENREPPYMNEGVIDQDKYLRVTTKGLEVLDPMSGEVLHRFDGAYNPIFQYPFIRDGVAYLNAYEAVEVLDIERLERVWRHEFSHSGEEDGLKVYGGPILYQDVVYVILSDSSIRALDGHSGEEIGKWQGRHVEKRWGIGTPISPGFAVGSDRLFVSFGTNELCAFGD
jgi:outer membrane protein assembly factor BamB